MYSEINTFGVKEIIIKIIKIFLTIYVILMAIIAIDGLTVPKEEIKTKYAIVYWSKVEHNWEVSNRLKARLDKSINLLKEKKVERIIVSGWIWETSFNEAVVMKKYLLDNGVIIPRILIDKNWYTTIDTSKHSYSIIKNKWEYPNIWVIWVSQFFHCSRVKLSLKKSGFSNISCASPDYFELRDIYSLIREVPAYIKYFFMWIWDDINIEKKDLEIIWEKIIKKIWISE